MVKKIIITFVLCLSIAGFYFGYKTYEHNKFLQALELEYKEKTESLLSKRVEVRFIENVKTNDLRPLAILNCLSHSTPAIDIWQEKVNIIADDYFNRCEAEAEYNKRSYDYAKKYNTLLVNHLKQNESD